MQKEILITIGITILFLGLAMQPSIAVNPIPSNNEEDCDICQKVSNLHLVRLKSLINRVETLDNKLSVLSKHNPEVIEKYQELSDKITTQKEMNKKLNFDWDFPIICNILLITQVVFEFTFAILYTLSLMSSYNRPTQSKILLICSVPFYVFVLINFVILKALKCE